MTKVIESVEVFIGHEEPDFYKVGNSFGYGRVKITDIIEVNGTFLVYDQHDRVAYEIRNCPVVVKYKYEEE